MAGGDSLEERVVKHLLAAADGSPAPEEITPDSSLREYMALNSLQAVSLMLDLEDEFGIVVEDDELKDLQTVGDVFRLVRTKVDAGA